MHQILTRHRSGETITSLSRPGTPHDNAAVESFFSSMKREARYRREYKSETEPRNGVAKYIDFYNTQRPHSTMKQQTPAQAEQAYRDRESRQGSDGKFLSFSVLDFISFNSEVPFHHR